MPAARSRCSTLLMPLVVSNRAAGAIKSGGTTRRAAKMVIVDVDHPDVEEFVDWKVREEQKVAALVTGSKVVLTVAHVLNDAPEDVRPQNLAALCQRCHNRYDAAHRRGTRRQRGAVGDLFPSNNPRP